MKHIRDTFGTTCMVVSHELASIFDLADRAVMLDREEQGIIAEGPPRDVGHGVATHACGSSSAGGKNEEVGDARRGPGRAERRSPPAAGSSCCAFPAVRLNQQLRENQGQSIGRRSFCHRGIRPAFLLALMSFGGSVLVPMSRATTTPLAVLASVARSIETWSAPTNPAMLGRRWT